jgi:hypothetical protein
LGKTYLQKLIDIGCIPVNIGPDKANAEVWMVEYKYKKYTLGYSGPKEGREAFIFPRLYQFISAKLAEDSTSG